jgi:hypothetical protein
MAAPLAFCRIENKYEVSEKDIPFLSSAFREHLDIDPYAKDNGHYQVNTIYFDDEDNDSVTRSLSHPKYKEKLRLRSYGGDKPIYFIEFKNKFGSDVYKVRILLDKAEYEGFTFQQKLPSKNGDYQHDRFVDLLADFVARHGGVYPHSLIQYDRAAFVNRPTDEFLRLTIDTSIAYRTDDFRINVIGGSLLLPPGKAILEVKIGRALPLWLAHLLNELSINRMAFSKYGTSYLDLVGKGPAESLAATPKDAASRISQAL